ncbi:MAG: hypothetical protein ACOCY1_04690 [Halovenus sp.]
MTDARIKEVELEHGGLKLVDPDDQLGDGDCTRWIRSPKPIPLEVWR